MDHTVRLTAEQHEALRQGQRDAGAHDDASSADSYRESEASPRDAMPSEEQALFRLVQEPVVVPCAFSGARIQYDAANRQV